MLNSLKASSDCYKCTKLSELKPYKTWPPSFCLFPFLSQSNDNSINFSYINWNSLYVVLWIRTWCRGIVGTDVSTDLLLAPYYCWDVFMILPMYCELGIEPGLPRWKVPGEYLWSKRKVELYVKFHTGAEVWKTQSCLWHWNNLQCLETKKSSQLLVTYYTILLISELLCQR